VYELVKIRNQKVWKIKDSRVVPLPTWWYRDKVQKDKVTIVLTKDGNLLIKPGEVG